MNNPDVEISVGVDLQSLKAELADVQSMLRKNFSTFNAKKVLGLQSEIKTLQSGNKGTLGLPTDYASNFVDINSEVKALGTNMGTTAKKSQAVNLALQKMDMQINRLKKPFAGWAMSIMFAGMAMRRTFDTIWASSSKMFNDVSHSIQGQVTGFDMLSGSVSYLQYTLGAALEPVAAWLAPIIMMVADWTSNNKGLTSGLLVTIGTLGTLGMTIGSAKLAMDGLGSAFSLVTGKNFSETALGKSLSGLGAIKLGVGFVLAKNAFDDLVAGDITKGLGELMTSAGLMASVAGKGTAAKWLVGIGMAFEAIDFLVDGKTATKDSIAKFFINTASGALFMFPGVGAALLTFGIGFSLMNDQAVAQFLSALKVAVAAVAVAVGVIFDAMTVAIKPVLNGMIMAYNLITGSNVDTIGFTDATNATLDKFNAAIDEYKKISGYNDIPKTTDTAPPSDIFNPNNPNKNVTIQTLNLNVTGALDWNKLAAEIKKVVP